MEQIKQMNDLAKAQIAAWYSAPAEALERDLRTLRLYEPLTLDERNTLIEVGESMLAAKKTITPEKPKRGRPQGSKTRKEASGNGE